MKKQGLFFDVVGGAAMFSDQYRERLNRGTKNSLAMLRRLERVNLIEAHNGCVNTIVWSDDGQLLLSGSDDLHLSIYNPFTNSQVYRRKMRHRANIFSARFLPQTQNTEIVSCSGDGVILYSNVNNTANYSSSSFSCHTPGTTYEVMMIPTEPRSFFTCGDDCTVRLFDLRTITHCHKTNCRDTVLVHAPAAITAMSYSPVAPNYIAAGTSRSLVYIYDRRYLSTREDDGGVGMHGEPHTVPVKTFTNPARDSRPYRITSVEYDRLGEQLLVNYSCDHVYLFDLSHPGIGNFDENTVHGADDTSSTGSKRSPLGQARATEGPPPVRRLRLRGDWSDTGPDARPASELPTGLQVGQARPQLQATIIHRMTEVVSRMLADPRIRMGLNNQAAATRRWNPFETSVQAAVQLVASEPQPSTSGTISYPRHRTSATLPTKKYAPRRVFHSDDDDDEDEDDDEEPARQNDGKLEEEDDKKDEDEDYKENEDEGKSETILEHLHAEENVHQGTSSATGAFKKPSGQGNPNGDSSKMTDGTLPVDYVLQTYSGHRNGRTLIKEATFWGDDYIMSGSDCGFIFTWDRRTGRLVMLLKADNHVVNCVQPHPSLPMLASSGIDYNIKVWAPIAENDHFDESLAEEIMKRNAVMLEETKDIITVPASFMIRMLACLHSLRNRANAGESQDPAPNGDEGATP